MAKRYDIIYTEVFDFGVGPVPVVRQLERDSVFSARLRAVKKSHRQRGREVRTYSRRIRAGGAIVNVVVIVVRERIADTRPRDGLHHLQPELAKDLATLGAALFKKF